MLTTSVSKFDELIKKQNQLKLQQDSINLALRSTRDLDSLLQLSRSLRAVSDQYRAIAEHIRTESSARRLKLKTMLEQQAPRSDEEILQAA